MRITKRTWKDKNNCLAGFREIKEEALGNELIDIMRQKLSSKQVSERFEYDFGVKLDFSALRRGLNKNSWARRELSFRDDPVGTHLKRTQDQKVQFRAHSMYGDLDPRWLLAPKEI